MTRARSLIEAVLSGVPAKEAVYLRQDEQVPPDAKETAASSQDGAKLRVLVVDHILMFGLSLAQRMGKVDGHEVVYASNWGPSSDSPFCEFLGRGSAGVELDPEGWMRHLEGIDVATVTGSEHRGHIVEFLRKVGVPVCGPDSDAVRLELDRQFGWEIARGAGIKVPWQQRFDDLSEVREYVEQNPGKYVLKLDQTVRAAGETLVSQDPKGEDLIAGLTRLEVKLDFCAGSVGYYLQELVEGTEVAISGMFNGNKIVGDRLLVSFDASSGFCYDLRVDGSALLDASALTAALQALEYRGPFDVNGMLTPSGEFVFLEWTPRWGSGITEFFCHSAMDLGELLRSVATGEDCPLLMPEVEGKVVVLVNVREEDNAENILSIILPKGQDMPVLDPSGVSFWIDNAAKTNEGKWVVLPVSKDEHRKGRYCAHAATLEEAIKLVDKLAETCKIAECFIDTARAMQELDKRVKTIYGHIKG